LVGLDGHVLAIDKAKDFLSVLRARAEETASTNVAVLDHDIEQAPIPFDGFDFVVARWLDPYVDDLEDAQLERLIHQLDAVELYDGWKPYFIFPS
jgi:ubiquinone/menaquinone biosynthesis C-methylase UbiE